MKNNLDRAIYELKKGAYTCVLCKDELIYTSTERGVKPLLDFLESDVDFSGFSAADKTVGNAAAYLYVILGVKDVYANVMSESAEKTLSENGIVNQCEIITEHIRNRAGTGFCPMEEAVKNAKAPEDALILIKARLNKLKNKSTE